MKITLNVIYNIVYNKEKIDPEEDIMLRIQHPHTMKFIDGLNDDNDFSIEPVANTDKKIEENNTLFSEPWTNEMRASKWEIEIKNEQWWHLFSSEHSSVLKIHFKIFQFNQDTGESEKNYDENKISSIKILDLTPDKNYELENKMIEERKLKE